MFDASVPRTAVRRSTLALAVAGILLAAPGISFSQNDWIIVAAPNFTVISNGSARSARRIASQFERVQLAIESTWPWARVQLDRPVVVIAARDERTMRSLVPTMWDRGIKPTSVFVEAADRHFITLRSDIVGDDTPNENPYRTAYWSYIALLLSQAFDPPLPLWLRNGLAGVLSNSIVRDDWVEFGRPPSSYVRTFGGEARLTLSALLEVDAGSDYYRTAITRQRFDAQSWAVVQYLLYGRPEGNAGSLNRIVALLRDGQSSIDAISNEFGDVDELDLAVLRHVRNGLFSYQRVATTNAFDERSLTPAPLNPVDERGFRMALHVAMNDASSARTLAAESIKLAPGSPVWFEEEGKLLERERKPEEARQAYAKAAELGSSSPYVLYRLVLLERTDATDPATLSRREGLLKRVIAGNPRLAAAHAMLADTYSAEGRRDEALSSARTAVSLDARSAFHRLRLARALWNSGQRDTARGHALAARTLAVTDAEKAAVQSLLDFIERSSQPRPDGGPTSATAGTPPAQSSQSVPEPAEPGPRPSTSGRVILDLRTVNADETRVLGLFQAIECSGGAIQLIVDVSGRTMRLAAAGLTDVLFVSFRNDTPSAVNCGTLPQPLRALITYRASPGIAGADGTAVAVELIPDDFSPR